MTPEIVADNFRGDEAESDPVAAVAEGKETEGVLLRVTIFYSRNCGSTPYRSSKSSSFQTFEDRRHSGRAAHGVHLHTFHHQVRNIFRDHRIEVARSGEAQFAD